MSTRLTVLGCGYLGATHAACMAELGFEVLGFDVDEERVAQLSAGHLPFYEDQLPELLEKHVASGRLRFTTSYEEVAEFGDVHFLCTGTPQRPGRYDADLSQVWSAITGLAPLLRRHCVIVGKSTVPVGTAAQLAEAIRETAPAGDEVDLVWNPEFLRESFAVHDTLHPDRIVVGVADERPIGIVREVYAQLLTEDTPFLVMDYPTAELVKGAANSFLATKISFINAMAEICEITGADVTRLSEALTHDDRIGRKFLRSGLGFGGGCLPKDIRAFTARAEELGAGESVSFLKEVDAVNLRRRTRAVKLAKELLGGVARGKHIAVLGAAFKPDSDDVRDSPALDVASSLSRENAHVSVYDPEAMANAKRIHPELHYCDTFDDALAGADVVLLLTEWHEFRDVDPAKLSALVRHRRILDGRNVLDPTAWRAAGWEYRALGRP
ncbi:MAG: nucleotide sugar dehydrogenase [Streptosporangiales bacterium]|nr:nucleotide sugar dehydrogenase [Streptosporangiales bacterium]